MLTGSPERAGRSEGSGLYVLATEPQDQFAPRVGPHDEFRYPPRPRAAPPERAPVVARKLMRHLLEVKAQIVAALVDRQVFELSHNPRKSGRAKPPSPPIKGVKQLK